MAKYAITGGASGIGAGLAGRLEQDGHNVLTIDRSGADICADLATPAGRLDAIKAIQVWSPEGLDGFIPCAGLPLHTRPLSKIVAVNFFGSIDLVSGVQDLVARKRGSILLVASNSARMIETTDSMVQACLSGDEIEALEHADTKDAHAAYAGSKRALTLWMRQNTVRLARLGARINAIAPGVTLTPMTEDAYKDEEMGSTYRSFASIAPWGGEEATIDQIVAVMQFMLSDAASVLCGAVIFADSGTDARLHPDLV